MTRPASRLPLVLALGLTLFAAMAAGHNTSGAYRMSAESAGVSGVYVGSASALAFGYMDDLPRDLTLDFQASSVAILCNLESSGASQGAPDLDESMADGRATPGQVPDGTWDDGGLGGACHPLGGCPDDQTLAYAEDLALGGDVWIAAACDFLHPVSGPDLVQSEAMCMVNEVLVGGGWPPGLDSCVGGVVDAAECVGGDPACLLASGVACGPDGVADAWNAGAAYLGVPFPSTWVSGPSCPADEGTPMVLTFVAVHVDSSATPPLRDVVAPTAGWIDSDWDSPDDAGVAQAYISPSLYFDGPRL